MSRVTRLAWIGLGLCIIAVMISPLTRGCGYEPLTPGEPVSFSGGFNETGVVVDTHAFSSEVRVRKPDGAEVMVPRTEVIPVGETRDPRR